MNPAFEFAASQLALARKERRQIARLPEASRPHNSEEAIEIQRRAFEVLGEPLGGWKCSVPAGDRMIVAPLPASTIQHSSPIRIIPNQGVAQVEPEIAFVLKHDLPPRSSEYTVNEIRDSIADTRLVLELMGSRYADHGSVTFYEALADSMRHHGMFIGPRLNDPFTQTLEGFRLNISAEGKTLVDREVAHPLHPITWLANYLSKRGETLPEGVIITTGSYAGILEIPMNVPVTFEYGTLGSFEVICRP